MGKKRFQAGRKALERRRVALRKTKAVMHRQVS